MTAPTVNGRGLLWARIAMPLRGVWFADVHVDAEEEDLEELLGDVELDFGEVSFHGTTRRGGVYHGRVELEVAGGAGGLETVLEPKFYADAPVSIILRDLANEAGETLAGDIPSEVTSPALAHWTRAGGTAGDAMGELARALGRAWRIRRDGTLWIGDEGWAEVDHDHDVVTDEPSRYRQVLGVDGPTLAPGTVLGGRRVSHVVHRIDPSAYRTEVWFDPDEQRTNPDDVVLAPMLEAYSGQWRRQDRSAPHPGRVVSQAADGSLEIELDDERWPSLTKVPIRTFVPGAVVQVGADARVLVGWEGARPDKPSALLFESGTLEKLSIVSSDLRLGGDSASDAVALASKVEGQLQRILDAISNAGVASSDGGATFKANIIAALNAPPFPESVGASKVKAE